MLREYRRRRPRYVAGARLVSAEPNGMSYGDLRDTLKAIAERTRVVGFDFVEVNPMLDVATGITSYLGAHTVIAFLGHICEQPNWREKRKAFPKVGKRSSGKRDKHVDR